MYLLELAVARVESCLLGRYRPVARCTLPPLVFSSKISVEVRGAPSNCTPNRRLQQSTERGRSTSTKARGGRDPTHLLSYVPGSLSRVRTQACEIDGPRAADVSPNAATLPNAKKFVGPLSGFLNRTAAVGPPGNPA